jgi:hypothetical protein
MAVDCANRFINAFEGFKKMSIRQIVKSLSDERWNIGFISNSIDGIIGGEPIKVNWVKHNYRNSWFADPFILDVTDDEIVVLVEEWFKPIKRGRISKLVIDKNTFVLKDLQVVLQLDTHLSFPVIERHDDGIYIYPENGASGNLSLYKYDAEKNKCEKIGVICDESVADAIATDVFGERLMFATKQPDPNGNKLCIYRWNDETHKYEQKDVVLFKENVARMAGNFFEYNGKIIRPTQECNVQYGHAVTLQEVSYENGEWSFKEIRRMYTVNPKLTVGMHTFNMFKGLIVTDALGFDRMWIRKILNKVKGR